MFHHCFTHWCASVLTRNDLASLAGGAATRLHQYMVATTPDLQLPEV